MSNSYTEWKQRQQGENVATNESPRQILERIKGNVFGAAKLLQDNEDLIKRAIEAEASSAEDLDLLAKDIYDTTETIVDGHLDE